MAGYSSAYDLGREVALESLADPGEGLVADLNGKSGATLIIADGSATDAFYMGSAAPGTVIFVLNNTDGNVEVSDSTAVVSTVATLTGAMLISTASGASYLWQGQAIATHA